MEKPADVINFQKYRARKYVESLAFTLQDRLEEAVRRGGRNSPALYNMGIYTFGELLRGGQIDFAIIPSLQESPNILTYAPSEKGPALYTIYMDSNSLNQKLENMDDTKREKMLDLFWDIMRDIGTSYKEKTQESVQSR